MYRGSAAEVLVERGFCANPPQKPHKFGYMYLVNVFRRHCMKKAVLLRGCSSRFLRGLLRKITVLGRCQAQGRRIPAIVPTAVVPA